MIARVLAALLAVTTVFAVSAAGAAEKKPYDAAAFAAAQEAGQPVLIHVTAPWCSTCTTQKPIVDELTSAPEFDDLTVFEIDFDTGVKDLKAFNARSQSTLIAFKGKTETGRSVGDTSKDSIAALLKTTL